MRSLLPPLALPCAVGALAAVLATPTSARAGADDAPAARSVRGCGTRQRPPAATPPPRAIADGPRVLYLNITGGTYKFDDAEATDSATDNVANVSDGPGSATIPPLDTSAFDWPWIRDCVRDAFAPYDLEVVEAEPTSGDYLEAVIGGYGDAVGDDQLYGIAGADNFCGVTERGIAFVFSEFHTEIALEPDFELCGTIAHEVGHLLALEHETLAEDFMSYVPVDEVDSKDFVDQDATCGEYPGEPADCFCVDTATTNSAARLREFVGEAREDAGDGGGCCQSGRTGGGPATALGVVVGAGLFGRRRRRRAA